MFTTIHFYVIIVVDQVFKITPLLIILPILPHLVLVVLKGNRVGSIVLHIRFL
jgi:hypothetical protein